MGRAMINYHHGNCLVSAQCCNREELCWDGLINTPSGRVSPGSLRVCCNTPGTAQASKSPGKSLDTYIALHFKWALCTAGHTFRSFFFYIYYELIVKDCTSQACVYDCTHSILLDTVCIVGCGCSFIHSNLVGCFMESRDIRCIIWFSIVNHIIEHF